DEMIENMMSKINNSGDDSLYGVLNLIIENKEFCKIILNEKSSSRVFNTILNFTYENSIAEKKKLPNANDTYLEYYFSFSTGGTIEVIRKWLNDDMKIPVEEVVQILESMYVS